MRRQSYPQGAVLFHKGDSGDSLYLILKGSVRIFTYDSQGNEITIRYLAEMFGEFSVLDRLPRSTSAAAEEDLDVLVLHRDDFTAFVRERPIVGLAVMRELAERARYTTDFVRSVLDATEQIAQGHYEVAQDIQTGTANRDIEQLVAAFVQMARDVQAREEALKAQGGR
jgi:CRP-like cAMP-binding protein